MSSEDLNGRVNEWLQKSEYSSGNPSSESTRSTTSSSAGPSSSSSRPTYREPSFPVDHHTDSEEEEEKFAKMDQVLKEILFVNGVKSTDFSVIPTCVYWIATWTNSSEILLDIARTSEFKGDLKLMKQQKKRKPVVEEVPVQEPIQENWNTFDATAKLIQKSRKASPPRSGTSSDEIRSKTAQAWAAKPVGTDTRTKLAIRGRGALLIKTPEHLDNLFDHIKAPAYHNSSIQAYINDNQFSDNSSDEDEPAPSNDTTNKGKSATPPKATTNGSSNNKYVPPNRRNVMESSKSTSAPTGARPKTTAPAAKPNSVYVPPYRRSQEKSPSNSEESAASNKTTDEELEQFVFSPKNRPSSGSAFSAEAPELVVEEKKPFSLLKLTASKPKMLPVDVVARRNPTVLKLMGKKEEVETPIGDIVNEKTPDSSYTTADNFTLSQSSEVGDFKLAEPKTFKPESLSFKPNQNPVLNAGLLSSKLEKLQHERGEKQPAEKENDSPDSCINDFSSCSEAELYLDDEDNGDGDGSSGFSDIETYIVEPQPKMQLKCVTLSSDEEDDYNPVQPSYCADSIYACDNGWQAGVNPRTASSNKDYNFNAKEFPTL